MPLAVSIFHFVFMSEYLEYLNYKIPQIERYKSVLNKN